MAKIWLLTRTEEDGRELLDQLISEGHWVTWNVEPIDYRAHRFSFHHPHHYDTWSRDSYSVSLYPHGCVLTVGFSEEDARAWMGTDLSKVLTCIE